MAIDVTVFINNVIKNNPNVSANVKNGVSSIAAFFGSAQNGSVNVSTLLNTSALPANVQANINKFNGITSSIQSGEIPTTLIPTGGAGGVTTIVNGVATKVTANVSNSGAATSSVSNVKANKGPDQAKNQPFNDGASRELLTSPTAPIGVPLPKVKDSIPILLQSEIRALMLQISWMSSQDDFTYNTPPRIGRYAMDNKTLVNYGYKDSNTGAYLGKNGVTTEFEFTYGNEAQDRVMEQFLIDQYRALIKIEAIRAGDKKDVVAGMLAVAYQFQDASPSIGSITNFIGGLLPSGDTGSLVQSATNLVGTLTNSLISGSGATQNSVISQTNGSGLITTAQALVNANPTGAVAAAGSLTDKTATIKQQAVTTQASTASTAVVNSLSPDLSQAQALAKKSAASVEVQKLKASASDFASSLPAAKAKDWRLSGTAQDSQKRPGSMYYNAGKYAIQVLAADITAKDTATAAESAPPVTPGISP